MPLSEIKQFDRNRKHLHRILSAIAAPDHLLFVRAREHLNQLAIPQGSLGRLEECAQRVVAITGNFRPTIKRKLVVIFAGDHGVVEEGVSAFPQEVTRQMVYNFIRGGAGINVLARHVGAEVLVVDIGVKGDLIPHQRLVLHKVASGTRNMAQGPAMRKEEAICALQVGVKIAEGAYSQGIDIIGTGDMGIGNTTPSSAIAAVLTGRRVEEVTGRGTGISDSMLRRKIEVVLKSIERNQPDPDDPLDVLAKVGGLEIAGITGLIIGAAFRKIPVVIDGFISTAAAVVAVSLAPLIREYLFAAHKSEERGHGVLLEWLGLKPLLELSMRLGEGTGAALGMSIIEAGVKIFNEVLTFDQALVRKPINS